MTSSPRTDPARRPPRRAVLFGHLLRLQATDKAAMILDRLEPVAVDQLIALLDLVELRLMANLAFARGRERLLGNAGLSPLSLARLLRAADPPLACATWARLDKDMQERVSPMLGERRQAITGHTPRRRDTLLAALRLRRLFGR
jgi:hypothetical protein